MWQVVSDRSVRVGMRTLKPGSAVPEGLLSQAQCESLAARGFLVPAAPPPPPPAPPAEPRSVVTGKPVHVTTPWMLDPEGLRGVDLDTLNVMIAERDPSVPPFEYADEAAAFLSQDFVAPSGS